MYDLYQHIKAKHVHADDRENLTRIFRLRYQVYCEEKHFIDEDELLRARPGCGELDCERLELDEYDLNDSIHFIVLDSTAAQQNQAVGTVRLVKYSENNGFPTGKHHPSLYQKITNYDLARMAEISRLCVDPRFRKRQDDGLYGVGSYNSSNDARRKYPVVMLTLLREMYRMSLKSGITYWLSSMEDTLYRYLKSVSMVFEPLDEDYIEYYGKVKTFIMDIEEGVQILASKRKDLYDYFQS